MNKVGRGRVKQRKRGDFVRKRGLVYDLGDLKESNRAQKECDKQDG